MPKFTISLPEEFGSADRETTERAGMARTYEGRRTYAFDDEKEPPIARWLATWASPTEA